MCPWNKQATSGTPFLRYLASEIPVLFAAKDARNFGLPPIRTDADAHAPRTLPYAILAKPVG